MEERDQRSSGENREKEQNKRLQRQNRDIKEEMAELAKKEAEASRKKHELVRAPQLLEPAQSGECWEVEFLMREGGYMNLIMGRPTIGYHSWTCLNKRFSL